ncbi:hypothetical protein AC244_17720 [Ensifer adhaerens]|uniref:Guanylate cyclase domain-containing protein n=1 Tax=Ensifer adhaerens TaxID=106592 RepID=A0A0L8BRM9_ENSAD|nr:adenylate/guanylate cyclase domain-containing protein [Ensifer adhaerens]KOF17371.1 hypothetical protein AC244_17720 [Ensifer adhaerens]
MRLPDYQRLTFRVGINLGDILVDHDEIFGDGGNVAARLEAMAEPGGVLTCHSVHEHVDRKLPVRFVDKGECELKNIGRRIRVFRAECEILGTQQPAYSGEEREPVSGEPQLHVLPWDNRRGV